MGCERAWSRVDETVMRGHIRVCKQGVTVGVCEGL